MRVVDFITVYFCVSYAILLFNRSYVVVELEDHDDDDDDNFRSHLFLSFFVSCCLSCSARDSSDAAETLVSFELAERYYIDCRCDRNYCSKSR